MVTHDTIVELAKDFLSAIQAEAERQLGDGLWRSVRSDWWVSDHERPQEASSKSESRQVLNIPGMLEIFEGTDLPEQKILYAALVEAGVPSENQYWYFCAPLIRHWCQLPDSLRSPENAAPMLRDFATAVIDGEVVTKSIDAFSSLLLMGGEFEIQEGVKIRSINDQELWRFGSDDLRSPWNEAPTLLPWDNWAILEIEITHPIDQYPNEIQVMRNAVVAALVLAGANNFKFIPLGMSRSYGFLALAREFIGPRDPQEFGDPPWEMSEVNQETIDKIVAVWPGVLDIMGHNPHYLRIPVQRLIEGMRRGRLEDAIIDFAVGLDALLLWHQRSELSYRFALRGSTVLSWNGGDKRQAFDDLNEFYEVRSRIVHGELVVNPELFRAKTNGENMLRDIWWWFYEDGAKPEESIRKIDDRIRS